MKYCTKCGHELVDEAVFCVGCGCAVEAVEKAPADISGMKKASKVLMILGTVVSGLYIIPLAWCIPMTVAYNKKLKNGEPISTGFKVCSLLFVSLIAGILMFCDND